MDQRYEFEYDIGQWTFGTVSVWKHRGSDKLRTCKSALKSIVRPSGNVTGQLHALKELQHPHITPILDVLEDENSFYIVSEFVQGGEISDWVERLMEGYVVQEQTCAAYIRQALLAMVHSHSAQVFHGSMNPSSLSLSSKMPDAIVKVSDFGLAAVLDPNLAVVQRNRSPYTAPEIISGQYQFIDGSADMYSLGGIAHALLVGRAPGAVEGGSLWQRMRSNPDEQNWSERSPQSRDFVQQLLKPWDERPTPARALQHSWLKGLQPIGGVIEDKDATLVIKQKTLCYMLATLMVANDIPVRDFEQLRMVFNKSDVDSDGLVPRAIVKRVLRSRCPQKEAVDAAIKIIDVGNSDVFDLCATACADLIAREFFAAGPTGQPLLGPFGAADLAPRMLRRFFEVFGGRQSPTINLAGLQARLKTATAREVEMYGGVNYDTILDGFPERGEIDAPMLTSLLASSGGRGTPLAGDDPSTREDTWGELPVMGAIARGGLLNIFGRTCGVGHGSVRRDDSPHGVVVQY